MNSKIKPVRRRREKVLVAGKLILKDSQGNIRMCLDACDAAENSRITLFGKNGESLCLTVDGDATCSIALMHRDGTIGASLTISSQGEPRFILGNDEGTPVVFDQSDLLSK